MSKRIGVGRMIDLQKEKEQVAAYCLQMSTKGLSTGTSGNISIRNPESGLVALSPSGMDYHTMTPDDVVILDADGKVVDGSRKPSSEWRLHTELYKAKPDMNAIVHTHSMFCTVMGCLGIPLKAVHYMIAGAGVSEIPVAPYRTFGTAELSDAAVAASGASRGVLLQNHGMVACGMNIQKAFSLAIDMEFCAELQWRCMCAGQPQILSEVQMAEVMEQFKQYGQKK